MLLVLTIQGSIWINFAVPAMRGQTIFFIAYLIVSAIQMGATIDYAIVISSRYMDLKQRMPIKDAITESLNQAFPTIFTSGTILTCAGFLIGEIASDPTVASIGVALGRGTLISIILVLFVLPQILLFGDFIIEKTALAMNISRPQKEVVGRVRVTGHVKGYVQGEIDADVSGVFQGQMKVSLDSHIPGRHGEVTHDDTQNPMLPGMTQDENVAAESETAAKEEQEEKKSWKKMRMKVLALCFSMTLTVSALAGNGRLTIQAATSQESSGTKETTEKDSTTSADTAENKNQIIEIADEKAFEEVFYRTVSMTAGVLGKTVKLTHNIDLSKVDFNGVAYFSGDFEGGGHTISNVKLQVKGSDHGLFPLSG